MQGRKMNEEKCIKCNAFLRPQDIALHKKMINRGAKSYMCLPCLAKHFNVSEELLYEKIEHFKKQGCSLFL